MSPTSVPGITLTSACRFPEAYFPENPAVRADGYDTHLSHPARIDLNGRSPGKPLSPDIRHEEVRPRRPHTPPTPPPMADQPHHPRTTPPQTRTPTRRTTAGQAGQAGGSGRTVKTA